MVENNQPLTTQNVGKNSKADLHSVLTSGNRLTIGLVIYFIVLIVGCMIYAWWIWGSVGETLNQPVKNETKYEDVKPLSTGNKADANVVHSNQPITTGNKSSTKVASTIMGHTIPNQMRIISNKTDIKGFNTTTTLVEQNATLRKISIQSVLSSVIREQALITVSLVFGTLGASIHGLTSLSIWLSSKKFKRTFLFWYLTRPPIGAALALVVYLLLRATLLGPSVVALDKSAVINGFGVAGLSALVGLMTPQITRKLRDVFDQFFGIGKPEEEKGDEPQKGTDTTISLSAEKNKIEIGKDSLLIAILTDQEGNPAEDIETHFAIFDSDRASLIEEQIPPKKTDKKGVAVIKFQAKKIGPTQAIATAKIGKDAEGKDMDLYDKIELEMVPTTAAVVATPADTTPPTIASRIPDKDAPNIDSNTPVKIVFSENMLESTINGNTIKLLNDAGAEVEGTTVSLDQSDKKAVTITHRPLEKGKKYTIKVTTGVKDSAGNAIASEEKWSFSIKTT